MKYLRYGIFAFLIGGLITRACLQKDVLFYDWDEGIYAEVSSELVERGSMQTTFNGEVWFNKPPLSHYLISTAFRIFEDDEVGGRMVMVVFASLLLVMTYLLSKKLNEHFMKGFLEKMESWERELLHFLPVFILVSAPIFTERATQLNTDAMLGVFWIGYFLYFDMFGWKLLYLTLGTLTKSLLGLYPFAFEFLRLRKESFSLKGVKRGLLLLVVPLSWHIANYAVYGDIFIKSHLMDQLVKRVTDPIELHYGGRLFYLKLAWENFNIFFILFLVAYLFIGIDILRKHKNPLKAWQSKDRDSYLIIFSALPFFVFLSLVQSKISWYFASLAPLFVLTVPYLYAKISFKHVRYLALFATMIYSMWHYIPATYAYKPTGDNRTDLVAVAECLAKVKGESVSVLLNPQERQNRNVLEAAQQQTETSFIYGGSPSFVYYSQKKVHYHYKPEEFLAKMDTAPLLVVSKTDKENAEYSKIAAYLQKRQAVPQCFEAEWEVYK